VRWTEGETVDEQLALREQTARNLAGLEHEQRGEVDVALALYEANLAEGFAGDWPYTRLAAYYAGRSEPEQVARVWRRAVEVFAALPRAHPQRAERLRAYRQRLKNAERALRPVRKPQGQAAASGSHGGSR
jgi:hypothetical protein